MESQVHRGGGERNGAEIQEMEINSPRKYIQGWDMG